MAAPVMLTGASGFIGGRVAARLAGDGIAVRCLVRESSDTTALEALIAVGAPVELITGELRDHASLERAVTGCELVIHCAAMVSDWGTVQEIRAINTTATRDLGAVAAAAGVRRFIQISTTDVYGYPGGHGVGEDHVPTGFANWYSQTKRDAETALSEISRETGMEIVFLRPASVYGPGSTDVVGELASAMRGGYLPLIRGGRAVAGLVYVDNVVDAVVAAMTAPEAAGEAFNVTDELSTSWSAFLGDIAAGIGCRRPWLRLPLGLALGLGILLEEAYRLLRRATGLHLAPLLSRQAVQVLALEQDFSAAKLRRTLGWEPRVGYEEGLAATLTWLREFLDIS